MSSDVILEIFRMPDAEEDFYTAYPFLSQYRTEIEKNYRATSRRKEILSEKVIIKKIFPGENVRLLHNEHGMPELSNGTNISISHTRNHIAIIVSPCHNVALDIEHISDRVKKVGRMFLREDEPFTILEDMLVAWCVKETMYKLFSSQDLTFMEIRLLPFQAERKGNVKAENLRTGQIITLEYTVTPEYVLTTAIV